ncbi:uncharacterized protein SCHCODRAFT_02637180 [Schizophyllum commune H4-8]|uniref:uncharacterized protein n=1 Tax=Schizophyllum commune (strain H4-8 / FGSC 9210) TaxID=578458 RepID=UPI00215F96A0|nr:uncharacterized protein SCHCODRAFT_02637180 [Schizophyllum commune H4-8]KAI5888600.1 hypothetical protein SCHCODRAFT_02637180 [Schizophyllum commune H4-8]
MSDSPSESNPRKATFKLPPAPVRDKVAAQEVRRKKALEEQKRRRAEKVDSARLQLESFAKLSLEDNDSDEDQGSYVMRDKGLNNYKGVIDEEMREQDTPTKSDLPTQFTGKRRKRKGKKSKLQVMHVERQPPNPKWADKCMYAELLEMSEDMPWDSDGIPADIETGWVAVAPVPVGKRCLVVTSMPSGTNATALQVPNTTLRSRLLGKSLIPPFPSPLPHATVLDCILDDHWRDNGILHVLDVLKWKGRDMMECETAFRFWWRDMRLAELPPSVTVSSSTFPSAPFVFRASSVTSATDGLLTPHNLPPLLPSAPRTPSANPLTSPTGRKGGPSGTIHRFAYPVLFVPIPYHTDTTIPNLLNLVLPLARAARQVEVPPIQHVEVLVDETKGAEPKKTGAEQQGDMEVDTAPVSQQKTDTNKNRRPSKSHRVVPTGTHTVSPTGAHVVSHANTNIVSKQAAAVRACPYPNGAALASVEPDGLLLYVAEAMYEQGTSPLASWVPIRSYEQPEYPHPASEKAGIVQGRMSGSSGRMARGPNDGPLDVFTRLIQRRWDWRDDAQKGADVNMEV